MASHPENQALLFDISRLPTWLEAGDRDGLLRLFLQTADATLQKIPTLSESIPRSHEAVHHEIHALKGAAVSVGAMHLAQCCKIWEGALPHQDLSAFQKSLFDLRASLDATRLAMQPHLIEP